MMIRFRRSLLSVVAVTLILSSTHAFPCGVERQSVKVGTDADIGKVNFNAPQNTTIVNLRAFPTPGTIPANNRISPEETTVWIVNATLTLIKLESDQDYHLVIQDASGNTMIAEIPAPSCVPTSSPMNPGVTSARAKVDAMFNVTTSFQTVNVPVRITGVGMHDFPHGQTGAAPNQIELHSVIDIVFNPGNATPDFTLSASPTSLSVTQGSSGSTTISTSVSGGFNSAISLSTSALPAGVTATFNPTSIAAPGSGSSTLTFSAGSTATTGTSNVTVTASGGGITHTVTIALTISASGGTTTQLLGNPGFENGKSNPAPWTLTTTHSTNLIINSSSSEPPHSGTFDAWMDGFGTTNTDTILQQVTIPANATSASLSFWLHIDTAETSTTSAFDTLQVQIRDSSGNVLQTLQTFSNLNHATGYQQHTYNLNSFIGKTIQVFLIGKEDFELQTSFVVDDFALNVTQ